MKDLREMRELAGITQFSLSRRSGVSRTRLSLAECGEVELNETEKRKITTFLLAAIQLQHARAAANDDLLAYLLFRWTGLRGSDAVRLTWDEIDWDALEINRLTQKRKKRVVLPIKQELLFALEAERDKRSPKPDDRVLLNPATGKPLTRPGLYRRMLALGVRAGVPDAHPHRYRDSFAVDMLACGANPYDVAKLLGDTVGTVEKHYAPFVKELRDRTRRIMESGEGLEKTHCTKFAQSEAPKGRIH